MGGGNSENWGRGRKGERRNVSREGNSGVTDSMIRLWRLTALGERLEGTEWAKEIQLYLEAEGTLCLLDWALGD